MPKPELEVEDILREIRHRVFSENGVMEEPALIALVERSGGTDASDVRINTYLATTDQLRRSLPPVRSDRSGAVAKIELWIKSRIERATRWFVYDQVNFNSAIHQVLCELREVQIKQEKVLSALQSSTQLATRRMEREQKLVNEEHKEELRAVNEELRAVNEELRLQISDSAVTIDRLRRNFEHRLTQLEKGKS